MNIIFAKFKIDKQSFRTYNLMKKKFTKQYTKSSGNICEWYNFTK